MYENKSRGHKIATCKSCLIRFQVKPKCKGVYCSKKCKVIDMVGRDNCKNRGRTHSLKNRMNMSLAHMGNPGYWLGKKFGTEHRRKISIHNSTCVGDKARNWRGGKSSLRQSIKRHYKYRQWISDVFTRDNYMCQHCGLRGGTLNAHHIDRFSDIVKRNEILTVEGAVRCCELWNINNGMTLCESCHREEHFGKQKPRKNFIP